MDKQGRLTKQEEFIPNKKYKVKKSNKMGIDIYEFIRFDNGMAIFKVDGQDLIATWWKGIFTPVPFEKDYNMIYPLHNKELHFIAQEVTKNEILTEILDKKLMEIQSALNHESISEIDKSSIPEMTKDQWDELAEDLVNDLRNALRWVIHGKLK